MTSSNINVLKQNNNRIQNDKRYIKDTKTVESNRVTRAQGRAVTKSTKKQVSQVPKAIEIVKLGDNHVKNVKDRMKKKEKKAAKAAEAAQTHVAEQDIADYVSTTLI